MKTNGKTLLVQKIESGTVIDHIEAGKGIEVLKAIKGISGRIVVLLSNVSSARMGKKDILKIEEKYLAPEEYNQTALISPDATIVTIRDFQVIKKEPVELPKTVKCIIKCKNPACVSNKEPDIISELNVVSKKPAVLKCAYCEQEMSV